MKKVAVVAGTSFDTQLGVALVEQAGWQTLAFPLSATPKEQSAMQCLQPVALTDYLITKLRPYRDEICCIFMYCNSLSAAVDLALVEHCLGCKVITPLAQYEKYAIQYENLLILAANGQSATKIEQTLMAANPQINMVSVSFLPLVEAIERLMDPMAIDEQLQLRSLLNTFAAMRFKGQPFDGLLVGCTHFPFLLPLLEHSPLPILNPAQGMLQDLASI